MPADKTISLEARPRTSSGQWRNFMFAAIALVVCFSVPLFQMLRFAVGNELYSYIPLMPFVSWYVIRQRRQPWPVDSKSMWGIGIVFLAAGAALLAWRITTLRSGAPLPIEDSLAMISFSFFLCLLAAACVFLGAATFKAMAFPLGILIFMVPMPVFLRESVESFLQYGSAIVADGMFTLSGMPFARQDLDFYLPGTALQVAPECSGIHSSWILLITSLLAGYLFLRSPWKRAILTLAVIPLSLLRNGFRVFTIGELCVHISPRMIDSPIHRHGGPIFFVLSLVPFFYLLAYLHKSERVKNPLPSQT